MSPNDSPEITSDMECIYESLNDKKKSDIKDFDSVAERKGESKKRIVSEIGKSVQRYCKWVQLRF